MSGRVRVKWWHSKRREELLREWTSRYYCVGETVNVNGERLRVVSMNMRWDDTEGVEMQSLGVISV